MKKILLFLITLTTLVYSCSSLKNADLLQSDNMGATLSNLQSGQSVKLAPGEYLLQEPAMLINKENITIDGNGATLVMNSMSSNVVHLTGCKNIRLINFKATHVEPSGPTGCTGNVIYADESTDVLIENCDLNGSGIVGIAAYNVDNLEVKNNLIHENSDYAIIYQGPSLVLENNVFEENGNGNVIYFGYVPKGGQMSWPPEHKIGADTQRPGLVMQRNVFK